jgi:curved DNA-binding protein CbpA
VLGLDPSKDYAQSDLKQAYTRMAKLHHPDVSKLKDAQQKFQGIMKAYKELLDEKENPQAYQEAQASQAWEGRRARPSYSSQAGQASQNYRQPNYSSDYDWSTNFQRGGRSTRHSRQSKAYRAGNWEFHWESSSPYSQYETQRQRQQEERNRQSNSDSSASSRFQRQIISIIAFFVFTIMVLPFIVGPHSEPEVEYQNSRMRFKDIGEYEPIGQFMERRSSELRGVPLLTQKQCIAKGVERMLALERAKVQKMPEEFARTVYRDLQERKKRMRS